MATTTDASTATEFSDFKVADLSLADVRPQGDRARRVEMPGLMALRERYAATQAARPARASPARCT